MNNTDEYKMLRNEILENMKSQQQISVTTISLTVSILTIVGSFKAINPYMFLIPLLLLLPSAVKIRDLKDGIMTLSGYLIARYECSSDALLWETNVNKYRKKYATKRPMLWIALECGEFPIAGIICELLYIEAVLSDIKSVKIIPIVFCILSTVTVIFLSFIAFNYPNMDPDNIDEKVRRWNNIFEENNRE